MRQIKTTLTHVTSSLILPTKIPQGLSNRDVFIMSLDFRLKGESIGMLEFFPCKDPKVIYKTELGMECFLLEPGSNISQELFLEDDVADDIDAVVVHWISRTENTTKPFTFKFEKQVNRIKREETKDCFSNGKNLLNSDTIEFSKV